MNLGPCLGRLRLAVSGVASAPGSLRGQLVACGVRCCVASKLFVASAPGSMRGQLVACSVMCGKRTWVPVWAAGGIRCFPERSEELNVRAKQ